MFFGHIGVALAAKPAAPKTSLGVFLIAACAIDILCGVFVLLGMESYYPNGTGVLHWSHGLFMSVVWSVLTMGIAFIITRDKRISLVIGLLVFSHWVLDFVSHPMGMGKTLPPDLPLLFGNSPKVGLGLYNSVIGAFITEFGILIAGSIIYLKKTKAKNAAGKWSFFILIAFLACFPLTMFLPNKLAFIATFITILLLPVGLWVDKHRVYVTGKKLRSN